MRERCRMVVVGHGFYADAAWRAMAEFLRGLLRRVTAAKRFAAGSAEGE